MAYEGWDNYTGGQDMYQRTGNLTWAKSSAGDPTLETAYPRFTGSGQYCRIPYNCTIWGNFSRNMSRVIVGCAFYGNFQPSGTETGSFGYGFWDNSHAPYNWYQGGVEVTFDSGSIVVYDFNGMPIIVTPSGTVSMNTWYFLEVDITFGHTGHVYVSLNGQPVASGSGDFLSHNSRLFNTGGTSETLYPQPTCNQIDLRNTEVSNGSMEFWVDDFYYVDPATSDPGSYPNNGMLGDVRVLTLFPSSDYSVAWTNPGTTRYEWASYYSATDSLVIISFGANAGTISYFKVVPDHDGRLTGFRTILNAPIVGSINMALFADNGGTPGNLLITGVPHTNPPSGPLDIAVATSGYNILRNNAYWIASSQSANAQLGMGSLYPGPDGQSNILHYVTQQSYTYTGSFPAAANPTYAQQIGTGNVSLACISVQNYQNVSESSFDYDLTYNQTNSVGAEDLFNCTSVLPTTVNVISIQVTGSYRKDDTQPHTMTQRVRSGSSDQAGTVFYLSSTWSYHTDIFPVDPSTGSSWTVTGANTLQIGYKLES
jgi:hypothetical protein